MTELTLSYFDMPTSRGEECRLALTLADVPFVDDRIAFADWPARKKAMPFGSVPTLNIEGRGVLTQSNAILIYIGTRFGLRPTEPFAAARHDAILETVEEIRIKTWHVLKSGDSDDEKKAIRIEFANTTLRDWAKALSAHVEGPFACGDKIQVADLKIWSVFQWFAGGVIDHIPTDALSECSKLKSIHEKVTEEPRIKAYRARFASR